MLKIKRYLKQVNQWNVIFYILIFLQLLDGWDSDTGYDWSSLWGAVLVWALYLLGYNALDRELEIKLRKVTKDD
jgi:hypothetical protein